MTKQVILSHSDIEKLCLGLGNDLAEMKLLDHARVYPIPRGGIPASYILSANFTIEIVDHPHKADFFFDDIIDSGQTMQYWCEAYPEKPFLALIDKTDPNCEYKDSWVVFPWENAGGGKDEDFEFTITRLLQHIGENANRGGLLETPKRVVKAWKSWTSGYSKNPGDLLKVFEDGAESYNEMVVVKDIPFYSHCEHHLAPFFGTATIAYVPDGKIVGLSKLSRLLEMFASRLQVQERLTNQVADAIEQYLEPWGVGVVIKARHLCMESRGIRQQGHSTVTSSLRGIVRSQSETRAEFMALVG